MGQCEFSERLQVGKSQKLKEFGLCPSWLLRGYLKFLVHNDAPILCLDGVLPDELVWGMI